jgi:hypothetical protein
MLKDKLCSNNPYIDYDDNDDDDDDDDYVTRHSGSSMFNFTSRTSMCNA